MTKLLTSNFRRLILLTNVLQTTKLIFKRYDKSCRDVYYVAQTSQPVYGEHQENTWGKNNWNLTRSPGYGYCPLYSDVGHIFNLHY